MKSFTDHRWGRKVNLPSVEERIGDSNGVHKALKLDNLYILRNTVQKVRKINIIEIVTLIRTLGKREDNGSFMIRYRLAEAL